MAGKGIQNHVFLILPGTSSLRLQVVILAFPQPEFTEFLGPEVLRQLSSLGSVFAERLAKDEAWCMVAWKGAGVFSEVLTTIHHENGTYTKEASPITLHLIVNPRRGEKWRHLMLLCLFSGLTILFPGTQEI